MPPFVPCALPDRPRDPTFQRLKSVSISLCDCPVRSPPITTWTERSSTTGCHRNGRFSRSVTAWKAKDRGQRFCESPGALFVNPPPLSHSHPGSGARPPFRTAETSFHRPLRLPSAFTVNHDLEGASFRRWLHLDSPIQRGRHPAKRDESAETRSFSALPIVTAVFRPTVKTLDAQGGPCWPETVDEGSGAFGSEA